MDVDAEKVIQENAVKRKEGPKKTTKKVAAKK